MKYFKKSTVFILISVGLSIGSCTFMKSNFITYQSVRSTVHKTSTAPAGSEIAVVYNIDSEAKLHVFVKNLTEDILVIDQTKSFFVNTDGNSLCYYDPTVHTTSNTDMTSGTKGANVNLGSVAGALGVGGVLGGVLGGINVGGSGTKGTSVTNTTYKMDMPQISIGPNGSALMSKSYQVTGIGKASRHIPNTNIKKSDSPYRFSVCISYSTDNGATFKKIVTEMYVNSMLQIPVTQHGRVNNAIRQLYNTKTDAMTEDLWILYVDNNEDYFTNLSFGSS